MKKFLCWILALMMTVSLFPVQAFAVENINPVIANPVKGDVNKDGKVDLKDLHTFNKLPAGADSLNGDSKIDIADFKALKLLMVGAEHVITFYDGDRVIDVLPERIDKEDNQLGQIPGVGMSSKEKTVLEGYYTDKGLTNRYFADDKLENGENPILYAKYVDIPEKEEVITFSSFSNMDADANISFTIKRSASSLLKESAGKAENDGNAANAGEAGNAGNAESVSANNAESSGNNEAGIAGETAKGDENAENVGIRDDEEEPIADIDHAYSLEIKDGSDPIILDRVDNGNGTYTIKAKNGFNPGSTYELSLANGWNFVVDGAEKGDSVRSATFSIHKDEITNLQMNDKIKYIQDTEAISYTLGDKTVDVLKDSDVGENGGSFVYSAEGMSFANGDIICIYVGTRPDLRDIKDGHSILDPAVYVQVTGVEGSTISFGKIDDSSKNSIYNIVDNFPIEVLRCPVLDRGALGHDNIENLDTDAYSQAWGWKNADEALSEAKKRIAVGDFVTFYEDVDNFYEGYEPSLFVARITEYNPEKGDFTYVESSMSELDKSMDTYVKTVISGDAIVSDLEQAKIEAQLEAKVNDSNFVQEAAYMLMDVVANSEEFPSDVNVPDLSVTDGNGNRLSGEELQLLGKGSGFELKSSKINATLVKSGSDLHFDGGLQVKIELEAQFETEAKEGTLCIDLSSTFIQEVVLRPTIQASAIKKLKIPVGVRVSADIDLMSYTNLGFEANIYTVAPSDILSWNNYQDMLKDEAKDKFGDQLLGELFPGKTPEFIKNLTVGDVINAAELVANSSVGVETEEGLVNDVWDVIGNKELMKGKTFTKDQIDQLNSSVVKTSIKDDFKEITESGEKNTITSKYTMSIRQLMQKYADTINRDTDWIKIVEQEIGTVQANIYGISIGVEFTFNVRTDVSLALGSSIEYEVGKRFTFWFEIGLFKPQSGSSTTDIIDERFAFEFYVMGRLGVKAGVEARVFVAIGTSDLASVGVSAEIGPYIKLYGFFIYDYVNIRPANSKIKTSSSRMAGALYVDFGMYFMADFDASALKGMVSYGKSIADKEYSLLTMGDEHYYFGSAYIPNKDENYYIIDSDKDSTNGISMPLSEDMFALEYMDLVKGIFGSEVLSPDKFNVSLSNPNFSYSLGEDGKGYISVTPQDGVRVMDCDMTISYLGSKLAFSKYDMTTTIPIVWTNLANSELNQPCTVKVRVGNKRDGYQTVWSKRVLKGQKFNLPTDTEIKSLIEYDSSVYSVAAGYGSQQTKGLTTTWDKVYDYDIEFREYALTVDDIQNADGTTYSKTFYARYGKKFNFYSLERTGTDDDTNSVYTRFNGVTADKVIDINGKEEEIDLNNPVTGALAEKLSKGVHAKACYVDDSVEATFELKGVSIATIVQNSVSVLAISEDLGAQEYEPRFEKESGNGDSQGKSSELSANAVEVSANAVEASSNSVEKTTDASANNVNASPQGKQNGSEGNVSDTGNDGLTKETGTVELPENNEEPENKNIEVQQLEQTDETDDIAELSIKVKKGTTPSDEFLYSYETDNLKVNAVTPSIGIIDRPTKFTVVYGAYEGSKGTVTFDTMGGCNVRTIHRIVGQPMCLPTPKYGEKIFDGWYYDEEFTNKCTSMTTVPEGSTTLYAKWLEEFEVTFNANGGEGMSFEKKKVIYTQAYGQLPTVNPKDDGTQFAGWSDAESGGNIITSSTNVSIQSDHTLYAQWGNIPEISSGDFSVRFNRYEYDGNEHEVQFNKTPEGIDTTQLTIKYKKQGDNEYITGKPVDIGVYDVQITASGTVGEAYLSGALEIAVKEYEAYGAWYETSFAVNCSVGGSAKQKGTITWSDGSTETTELALDKKTWNTATYAKTGVRPTGISTEAGANAFGLQTVYVKATVKDASGNEKTVVDFSQRKTRRPNESWGINIPSCNTNNPGITVLATGKAAIKMITYGVDGEIEASKLSYTTSSSAVTVNDDKLIIDGSKLNSGTNEITVRANGHEVAIVYVNKN